MGRDRAGSGLSQVADEQESEIGLSGGLGGGVSVSVWGCHVGNLGITCGVWSCHVSLRAQFRGWWCREGQG